MKKFLTLCLALGCTVMANAQFPDKSAWQDGQDVSAELSWGDYDGTWPAGYTTKDGAATSTPNPSPFWQGDQPNELALDDADGKYPALGFYVDGAAVDNLIDMYQVIPLPAGYYKVTVNATYREGKPDDTWQSYIAGNPKPNAHLYVNTLNSDNPEDVNVAYDRVIKSLPYSNVTECQFTSDMAGSSTSWKVDGSYTLKGANEDGTDKVVYYPCCDEGAAMHFALGNYLHELKFILLEDGYIRLGLKKTANIAEDWFIWSNFHIYYESDADEDAQIELAYETYMEACGEIEALMERISDGGYLALNDMLSDDYLGITGDMDDTDLASINETTQALIALRAQYEVSFNAAKSLGDLLDMSEDMAVATDFPGAAAFASAIAEAKAVATEQSAAAFDYDPAAYTKAFNALSAARATYLDSQDFDEDGNKDFTMLIKNPWFVNAEYTPEYLPVDGNEGTKAWQLTEETWADRSALGNPGNYSGKVAERTDIASDVILSADTEATNQWFKRVNYQGWSPGLQLYYQSCLIGPSSGWNSISSGSEEICQQLVGLPNGYYSLRALMRGDGGAGWTTPDGEKAFHNIYAKNGAEEVVKSDPNMTIAESNNNMSNNWYEWNPLAWTEHRTGIIQVADGKLLIAAQTTNVMNATGFRLFFHGETPAFDKMIQPDLDAVVAKLENLAFEGDKVAVNEILEGIVLPIGQDATIYEADMALIKQANAYIAAANDYMKNYKALENFTALQGEYGADTEQFAILDVPFQYVMVLGNSEEDTYEDAKAADKMYEAYAEYMPAYDKALKYTTQEIATLIAEQTAALKANMGTPEQINEYIAALSAPTNVEMIKQLGGENASEENPLDITSILNNPTFVDTKGWEGTSISQNEYARNNAEIWNQTTFDFYQSIKYMPAGKYKVTAQALYRDGAGSADLAKSYQAWNDCGQDKAKWANHNASLYVKVGNRTGSDFVTSVCDTKLTGNSFEKFYANESNYPEVGTGTGKFLFFDELHEEDLPYAEDYVAGEYFYTTEDSVAPAFQYPFDGRVDLEDGTSLFFPESMAGAYLRFAQDEYPCEAMINATEAGTLQVGINKTAGVSGDWVIFSNFKLYYLGAADMSIPEPNPSFNLVDDASYNFNDGTVGGWHYLNWNNGGTFENVAPGYKQSAGAMALTSKNPNGDPWGAQLLCPLKEGAKLEIGKTYIVSFYAKGTVEGDYLAPGAGGYPNPEWNNAAPAVLSTEWQQFTYTLVCDESNTDKNGNTQVYFNQGKLTGTAYIDRFMVYDAANEVNPEGNLIADDASFAFNDGTTGGWKMNSWNNAGSVAAVENGWNGSAYCLELTPDGTADQNYKAQVPYNLTTAMEVGKTYHLSFYAKAENEGAEIEFGAQLSPWAAENKEWNGNMFTLTNDWDLYELDFEVTSDYPAKGLNCLYINYGKTNGKAYVDHIVLVCTSEEGPTAIETVETKNVAREASFNLAGQAVAEGFKGIVIKNGKKFLVK